MTIVLDPIATDQQASAPSATPHELVWSQPETDVWAATETGPHRRVAAGFVHLVGGRHLAVDGLGAGIGAFDDLAVAQSAVALAATRTLAPSVWMRER